MRAAARYFARAILHSTLWITTKTGLTLPLIVRTIAFVLGRLSCTLTLTAVAFGTCLFSNDHVLKKERWLFYLRYRGE